MEPSTIVFDTSILIDFFRIGLADLLIGATARRHKLPVATLNLKHFDRIPQINLIITSEE